MRTSFWNAMNGVTAIVGSLFTYGLGSINTDKVYKYQVIDHIRLGVRILRPSNANTVAIADRLSVLRPPHRSVRCYCLPTHAGLSHGGKIPQPKGKGYCRRATTCKPDGRHFPRVALGPRLRDLPGFQDVLLVLLGRCNLVGFKLPSARALLLSLCVSAAKFLSTMQHPEWWNQHIWKSDCQVVRLQQVRGHSVQYPVWSDPDFCHHWCGMDSWEN